jgi:nucleotide-binding universal stress UspA family protein
MGNDPATAKVLAATDLSAPADEAIRQAHEWATRHRAELVVCHIIPTLRRANPLFPQRNEADSIAAVDLERRVAELVVERVSQLTGRSPDAFGLLLDVGRPEAEIIRAAVTMKAELIVMGNRGDTGLDRIPLGSVSERVVQHAHCSVLVARPVPAGGCVLVATDLSDSSFAAITAGATEARRRGAKLVVLHNLDLWPSPVSSMEMALGSAGMIPDSGLVEEEGARATQQLEQVLARRGLEAECMVTHGPPDAAIVKAADALSSQLLVIGTHGRTGLARLALGSVAQRVVEAVSCSVLVVRSETGR